MTQRTPPRRKAPDLRVPLVGGGTWSLHDRTPAAFSLIVVYRGLHCPLCKTYLGELESLHDEFAALGTDALAVSADGADRAAQAARDWGLGKLAVGHDMPLSAAAEWGLYLSDARREAEPPRFFEPGLFLVAADGTLYFAATQNMPFGRPPIGEFLKWIPKVQEMGMPARGEVDPQDARPAAQVA